MYINDNSGSEVVPSTASPLRMVLYVYTNKMIKKLCTINTCYAGVFTSDCSTILEVFGKYNHISNTIKKKFKLRVLRETCELKVNDYFNSTIKNN